MRREVRQKSMKGQATIEMAFTMIMILLLMFGLIKVWQWSGLVFADQQWSWVNDKSMLNQTDPMLQLQGTYFHPRKIHGQFEGDVTW